MQIRPAILPQDLTDSIALDRRMSDAGDRAAYLADIADRGGLVVARTEKGQLAAFSCLDQRYFFGKPFLSLLMVCPDARRQGLATALMARAARTAPQVWTSTNVSNDAMRAVLAKAGWTFCGQVDGLDPGDPELFFRSDGSGSKGP